jgi:AcrR family transcriptional regulator
VSLSNHYATTVAARILSPVPKLWKDTIETHRRAVRDAAVDVAATLVEEQGLRSVTMSEIAERTGIGRATLYKYFPDVESILRAWHERQIGQHLDELTAARDRTRDPSARLRAVLVAFAAIAQESHGHRDTELAALLHRDHAVGGAQARVVNLIGELIEDAAAAGTVRPDIAAAELASYCVHALSAARGVRSGAALARLVDVTIAGLRPEG